MAVEAVENQKENAKKAEKNDPTGMTDMDMGSGGGEMTFTIVGIVQRIKVELEPHEVNSRGGTDEIWALIEFESHDPDQQLTVPPKRSKVWKKFDSEMELSDYIRRDTGEPLTLPPYSLTPKQSAKIEDDTQKEVTKITEDFRRFRVKSEMARKQAEAQIRDLQNSNVESAKRRIESHNDASLSGKDSETSRSLNSKIEKLRTEMTRQEAQWKEAYEALMIENETLRSSSSQAMVASQWRQRYEICLKEKEEIVNRLKEKEGMDADSPDGERYEMKYRDLKESFRLYRKKAKEIFDAREQGMPNVSLTTNTALKFYESFTLCTVPIIMVLISSQTHIMHLSEKSNEDSKLSYLKNLMVNYLTADPDVREHMEGAIGTVLQFTPEDIDKIEQKKNAAGYFSIF
jgi:GRIP domain